MVWPVLAKQTGWAVRLGNPAPVESSTSSVHPASPAFRAAHEHNRQGYVWAADVA